MYNKRTTMKFIKVTTKHTELELKKIITECDEYELDQIKDSYSELDYVEFIDENGFVGMYCIMNDLISKKLVTFYVEKSIKFTFEDLSKDILFENEIKKDYKLLSNKDKTANEEINELSLSFYESNINVDTILDKINEKGISSLNEIDKNILK